MNRLPIFAAMHCGSSIVAHAIRIRPADHNSLHRPQCAPHRAAIIGRDLTQLCNIFNHDL